MNDPTDRRAQLQKSLELCDPATRFDLIPGAFRSTLLNHSYSR